MTDDGPDEGGRAAAATGRARLRGVAIRAAREALGLNQTELAAACRVSRRTLCKIEAGVPSRDATTASRVARHLGALGVAASVRDGGLTIRVPVAALGADAAGVVDGVDLPDALGVR